MTTYYCDICGDLTNGWICCGFGGGDDPDTFYIAHGHIDDEKGYERRSTNILCYKCNHIILEFIYGLYDLKEKERNESSGRSR